MIASEKTEIIRYMLIKQSCLITHRFALSEIDAAYDVFEKRKDHVIKAAVVPDRQM